MRKNRTLGALIIPLMLVAGALGVVLLISASVSNVKATNLVEGLDIRVTGFDLYYKEGRITDIGGTGTSEVQVSVSLTEEGSGFLEQFYGGTVRIVAEDGKLVEEVLMQRASEAIYDGFVGQRAWNEYTFVGSFRTYEDVTVYEIVSGELYLGGEEANNKLDLPRTTTSIIEN